MPVIERKNNTICTDIGTNQHTVLCTCIFAFWYSTYMPSVDIFSFLFLLYRGECDLLMNILEAGTMSTPTIILKRQFFRLSREPPL